MKMPAIDGDKDDDVGHVDITVLDPVCGGDRLDLGHGVARRHARCHQDTADTHGELEHLSDAGVVVLARLRAFRIHHHREGVGRCLGATDELYRADCRSATFEQADLSAAILKSARLDGAILVKANLQDAILDGASLRSADLRYSNLHGVSPTDAVLDGANLEGVWWSIESLEMASDVHWDSGTVWRDLQEWVSKHSIKSEGNGYILNPTTETSDDLRHAAR